MAQTLLVELGVALILLSAGATYLLIEERDYRPPFRRIKSRLRTSKERLRWGVPLSIVVLGGATGGAVIVCLALGL